MDVRYFLNILWKRKWLLFAVIAATAVLTYLLASQLAKTYRSNAILSTGIIEYKGVNVEKENPFIQQFQVTNAFDNLKEAMLSRSTLKLLTKRLLQHDLQMDSTAKPFRLLTSQSEPVSKEKLSEFARNLDLKEEDYLQKDELNPEKTRMLNQLAASLKYDYESLREHLVVKRIGETDYLDIEFTSENPELSYFTVNVFCEEILKLDKSIQTSEESSAVNFYKTLVVEKKKNLDDISYQLNRYRANKNLVNLEEQTKSIVGQLRELELLREQNKKNIPSLQENINNLDHYLKRTAKINADNYSKSVWQNEDIQELDQQITQYNELYISTGRKNENLQTKLTDLREKRRDLAGKLASREVEDATENARQNRDLLDKKIDKELELLTAKESVKSLDKEISKLKSKQNSLVSDDAYIGNLEQQLEIARKEYFDVVDKLHQAEQLSKKPDSRLSIIEPATLPEKPEPSKKILLSAFAGASSGILATIFLFVLAFFDNSLSTPFKFRNTTGLPLIGAIKKLSKRESDLQAVFFDNLNGEGVSDFRETLRKIRFAIETSGASNFLITSTQKNVGKSFFTLALAYSLSLNKRRVLIIDANFKNNTLSAFQNFYFPDLGFFTGKDSSKTEGRKALPENIKVLGNPGLNMSPTEALAGQDFVKALYDLADHFDYVLMEGPALNDFADSRELALFAEKIICVFGATQSLHEADKDSIKFLTAQENKFMGSILNKVEKID